jgi:DNA-directed RNA polymerase subunit M/transcription elongation factor TFIIS
MRINIALPFSLVLPVLIVFSIDPDTSLVIDNTYKINYRDTASEIDDKRRDKSSNNSIQNDKHICLNCESLNLSFESLNTYSGKQIQLINCRVCDYEWQETWILPNWFWLKSSSPNNHWTSERWNTDFI